MTTQEIRDIIKEKYQKYHQYNDNGDEIQFIDLCLTEEEKILNKLSGNGNYGLYNSIEIDIIKNIEIKIILKIYIKLNNKLTNQNQNTIIWRSVLSFAEIDNDKINKMFDIIDSFSDAINNFTMGVDEISVKENLNDLNNQPIQKLEKLNKNNIAYFIDNFIDLSPLTQGIKWTLAQKKYNMFMLIIVRVKMKLYQYLNNNEKFVNGMKAVSMPLWI